MIWGVGGAGGASGGEGNTYWVLVGTNEGNRSLGRAWHRWKDNINIDLKGQDERLWIGFIWLMIVTWRAVLNMIMTLPVP